MSGASFRCEIYWLQRNRYARGANPWSLSIARFGERLGKLAEVVGYYSHWTIEQQEFFQAIEEEESPGWTPAANRPLLEKHLEETFEAFSRLWRGRNSDHITLVEIESYVRLFSIPDKQRFAELIIGCDEAVWDSRKEATDKQAARDRLKGLKK